METIGHGSFWDPEQCLFLRECCISGSTVILQLEKKVNSQVVLHTPESINVLPSIASLM